MHMHSRLADCAAATSLRGLLPRAYTLLVCGALGLFLLNHHGVLVHVLCDGVPAKKEGSVHMGEGGGGRELALAPPHTVGGCKTVGTRGCVVVSVGILIVGE